MVPRSGRCRKYFLCAIDNYRQVKKLLREWEENTERLIDAEQPQP
jgi:hypothetical protein